MKQLPPELLVQIFGHLSLLNVWNDNELHPVRLVCHLFRRVCTEHWKLFENQLNTTELAVWNHKREEIKEIKTIIENIRQTKTSDNGPTVFVRGIELGLSQRLKLQCGLPIFTDVANPKYFYSVLRNTLALDKQRMATLAKSSVLLVANPQERAELVLRIGKLSPTNITKLTNLVQSALCYLEAFPWCFTRSNVIACLACIFVKRFPEYQIVRVKNPDLLYRWFGICTPWADKEVIYTDIRFPRDIYFANNVIQLCNQVAQMVK